MSGTPKTLRAALINGLMDAAQNKTNTAATLERHLQDCLAQHFCVARIRARSQDEEVRLDDLWKSIVREEVA